MISKVLLGEIASLFMGPEWPERVLDRLRVSWVVEHIVVRSISNGMIIWLILLFVL